MTLARFLVGIPIALFAFVPMGLAAGACRQLLFPDWRRLDARLVEIVFGLASIMLVAQVLGSVGLFAPAPLAIGLAASGTAAWFLLHRQIDKRAVADRGTVGERREAESARRVPGGWQSIVAGTGIVLVAGAWMARTIRSIERGMTTVDTLWYHLPIAARFVQTNRVSSVLYVDDGPVTAFFPATSSLFHAIGILFFRTDLVSTVVNLGWLALALVAAWCIGRPFGAAPATTLGAALVLGTPGLVATQPGGAYNDVAGLALLLTAIAVLVHDRDGPRSAAQDVVAGLAAGLALGTKFTFILPAVLLCLGLGFTAPRGLRLRRTCLVVASIALTGGYWYARNAIVAGNPLPSLALSVGPLTLPSVKGAIPTSSVSEFLLDGNAWTQNFVPGLRSSLGPAWIAIVVLALVGLVGAVAQRDHTGVRMLGAVGIASAVAFIFSPQFLVGGLGRPLYFSANLRYGSPALIVGLVLLPIVFRQRWTWVLGTYALVLLVTALDPTLLPTGLGWGVFQDRVSTNDTLRAGIVLLVVASIGAGLIWVRRTLLPGRVRVVITGTAIAVIALLGLATVHGVYVDGRYVSLRPYPKLFSWARGIHDERIAVVGLFLPNQYAIVGLDLSNHVQYAGVRVGRAGYRAVRTCPEWLEFLESGRFDYAVVAPTKDLQEWTAAQPDARLALKEPIANTGGAAVRVFRLDPERSSRTCA